MLRIEKILVPTDYSACAEQAFSHAAYLADRFEADLHVLNIREQPERGSSAPGAFPGAESGVDEGTPLPGPESTAREVLRGRGGHVTEVQVTNASAADGIVGYAGAHDIDLIVMGTHGRRGTDRLLMGSVAEEVVRRASVPVFTVREKERAPPGQLQSMLVPVDFSSSTQPLLQHAVALAQTYGARLDLLHVIENTELPGVYGIAPVSYEVPKVLARTREALTRLMQQPAGAQVPFEVHVLIGHAAQGILDFAAEHRPDLIVIATHGWSGIKRFWLGSVTEKVVREAPCPVFTMKSFGKSLLTQAAEDAPPASGMRPTGGG